MSNIIFNEQKVLDELFENNTYSCEDFTLIQILIKYFYLKNKYTKLEIREKVIETISKANNTFSRVNWYEYIDESIEKIIKKSYIFGKESITISNINYIKIYKEEIDLINSCKKYQLRKVLFVLLVYAKIYDSAYKKNGWYNGNFSNILKLSKTKIGNSKYRLNILKQLKDNNYIDVFYKKNVCNIKIKFLCDKSNDKEILTITDFDNCIYDYLIYCGENWKKCEVCNKYFKIKNKYISKQKYCANCAYLKKKKSIAISNKKRREKNDSIQNNQ